MADLVLKGMLCLLGSLKLKGRAGGKVLIDSLEVLVEGMSPPNDGAKGSAPPVIQPPPPAGPLDPDPTVSIISSLNKTITAGGANIVAQGMVIQGKTWPGIMLPSSGNTGPVTINGIPANVMQDTAVIFPSGASAIFTSSGQ